jgi:magnesium chelatase subunit I
VRVSAGEFILEGLYAHRRISRTEEQGFVAGERERKREREVPDPDDIRRPSSRKQFN